MLMDEWILVRARGEDLSWSIREAWAYFLFRLKERGKKNDSAEAGKRSGVPITETIQMIQYTMLISWIDHCTLVMQDASMRGAE